MDSRIYVIVSLIVLILIGAIIKVINIAKYNKKIRDTNEYSNKFTILINEILAKKRINSDLYNWLTEKVNFMQVELGTTGLLHEYIDPLKGIHAMNYQLLLNFLPETHAYVNQLDNGIVLQDFNMSVRWCVDMFLRHIGDLKELHKKEKAQLYNPFSCLGEAIRYIIYLPLNGLCWMGIISINLLDRIKESFIIKIINFIVIIIGLISAIITIVLGWSGFVELLDKLNIQF